MSTPVFGLHEKIVGCIILLGTFAESMIEEYGFMVASVARQISQKYGIHMGHILLPSIEKRSP